MMSELPSLSFVEQTGAYAVCAEKLSGALRCLDVESEFVETPDQREGTLLVGVADGDEHGAVVRHGHA